MAWPNRYYSAMVIARATCAEATELSTSRWKHGSDRLCRCVVENETTHSSCTASRWLPSPSLDAEEWSIRSSSKTEVREKMGIPVRASDHQIDRRKRSFGIPVRALRRGLQLCSTASSASPFYSYTLPLGSSKLNRSNLICFIFLELNLVPARSYPAHETWSCACGLWSIIEHLLFIYLWLNLIWARQKPEAY